MEEIYKPKPYINDFFELDPTATKKSLTFRQTFFLLKKGTIL